MLADGVGKDREAVPAASASLRPDVRSVLSERGSHIHMVGIGGVGMAGVAYHLAQRNLRVSGCDAHAGPLLTWLTERGVDTASSHSPAHLEGPVDMVVRTTAVPLDHPELLVAARKGIPVYQRGEVLAAMLEDYRAVAVAGTHGKTTTSALIGHLLKRAGRSPSTCIGGEVSSLGGVAESGESDLFVAEADESDGTLVHYHPAVAVVLNIDFDHMEHFSHEAEFVGSFTALAEQATEVLVFCGDDARARRLPGCDEGISFGLSEGCRVTATDLTLNPFSSSFMLRNGDRDVGRVTLPLAGRHNVLNALAACATAWHLGVPDAQILDGFAEFVAPKRRFEVVSEGNDVLVISDYAHHPTEIAALVASASQLGRGRIVAVFQPHRYTRTLALGPQYPAAFVGVDELILTPVYPASEAPLDGGTTRDLLPLFERVSLPSVLYAPSLEEAWAKAAASLQPGDTLLVVGAGDVEQIAGWAKGAEDLNTEH